MAYTISPGAVCLVTFEGRLQSQQVMNVSAWLFNTGSTLPDGRVALNAIINRMQEANQPYALWIDCLSSQVTQGQITAQWVYPTRYGYVKANASPSVGQVGGAAGAPNVAVCITRRTGLSGRKQQSDIHMFGVPAALNDNGVVNVTGKAKYDAYGDAMTRTVTMAVPAFSLAPVPFSKVAPANVSQYIEYQTQNYLRVMRRRTVGLGS